NFLWQAQPAQVGLRLRDAEAQFVSRRVDVGDETPAEPRAHAFLEAREVGGRFVGGNDDLPVLVNQRIEGVKEFFLRRILAADELDVVDHQQVDRAELLLEVHRRAEPQSPNELVNERYDQEIDAL